RRFTHHAEWSVHWRCGSERCEIQSGCTSCTGRIGCAVGLKYLGHYRIRLVKLMYVICPHYLWNKEEPGFLFFLIHYSGTISPSQLVHSKGTFLPLDARSSY